MPLENPGQIKAEINRRYREDIQPILEQLKGLLNADRASYAPSALATAAHKLDEGFKGLDQFLADIN